MELDRLVRPNIQSLKGYSSARHEFEGEAEVYLDANENPYQTDINRYPDPFQSALKERLAEIKEWPASQVFLGNGSDEAIDLILRIFCEPGRDNILICPPTYGMYKVSADINNVDILEVSLCAGYQLDTANILKKINAHTKVIFLCSPNNPSGNLMNSADIELILQNFSGIVVIDEAYIDFAEHQSFIHKLNEFPRLIVLQTLSKAWGAAGIRLGMAMASKEIIALMNKVKPPYNVNILTQNRALEVLSRYGEHQKNVSQIISERNRLHNELVTLEIVEKVHPSNANFLLVQFQAAKDLFFDLREKGIIVRDRTTTHMCDNCLRLTIGRSGENDKLLAAIKAFQKKRV